MTDHLPALLRYHRTASGRTVRELAETTYTSTPHASNIEHGRRVPSGEWVRDVDDYLGAGGQLVDAWRRDQEERDRKARLSAAVSATDATASELLAMPDVADLDALHGQVADLSVSYLHTDPETMLAGLRSTYDELVRRVREHAYSPEEQRDLFVALGRASGVLSYATLDTGHPEVAARHAEVAFQMGIRAGYGELSAWARGTSSLVNRFNRDYERAQAHVMDGLRYANRTGGTARARLLSGAGQCAANLGHPGEALDYLDQAAAAHAEVAAEDPVKGLFTFTEAKRSYYEASTLMWVPTRETLDRAVHGGDTAIALWEREGAETRSLDDERLAHVYVATAHARAGDLDAAMTSVEPVLALPSHERISWMRKRVRELADIVASHSDDAAESAAALHDWANSP